MNVNTQEQLMERRGPFSAHSLGVQSIIVETHDAGSGGGCPRCNHSQKVGRETNAATQLVSYCICNPRNGATQIQDKSSHPNYLSLEAPSQKGPEPCFLDDSRASQLTINISHHRKKCTSWLKGERMVYEVMAEEG